MEPKVCEGCIALIFIGVSGAGKSTLIRALATTDRFRVVRRETTRAARSDDDLNCVRSVKSIDNQGNKFMYKGWGNDIYSMDFEDIHANVERNTVLLIELGDLEIAEALRRRLPGSKILLVIRHIDPNYLSQTLIGRGVSKRDADRRLATLKSDLEAMDQCSEFCDLTLFNEGNSHDLSRLVGRIHEFLGTSSGDDN